MYGSSLHEMDKTNRVNINHRSLLWQSNESFTIFSKNTRPRDVRNYMLQIKPENNVEYLFRAVWRKTKLGLK